MNTSLTANNQPKSQQQPRRVGLEATLWSSPERRTFRRKSSDNSPLVNSNAHTEDNDRGRKRQSTSMKRGANEYITKEHGSTPNQEGAEDKPKMATAAQQARRKIIQPKSRTQRGNTPTGTSSFGQSTGFQFGGQQTSQSFPPPTQSQQFQFNVPNTGSSFTFGGEQNGNAQSFNNPFANMNGANTNDVSMGTSPQKQPPTGGTFNFGNTSAAPSQPATNGFNFGQPAQQPATTSSGNGFGGGALFSQKPQETATTPSPSLFGAQPASPAPQTNGFNFGQPAATSAPSNPFGQTTSSTPFGTSTGFGAAPAADSTRAASPAKFEFGKTNVVDTEAKPEETATPKEKPKFSFGSTSTFGQPAKEQTPATEPPKPAFSFAGTQPDSTSQSTPSKSLFNFGNTTKTDGAAPATEPAKSGFNFGQPLPGSGGTGSVGGMQVTPGSFAAAQNKPLESEPAASLFGRASPADDASKEPSPEKPQEEQQAPKNPFAGLFAPQKSEVAATPSDSAKPVTKPLFSFGQASTSTPKPAESSSNTTNLFGQSTETDTPSTKAQPTFSFGASTTASAPSSGGLFSPKPAMAAPSSDLFSNLNKFTPATESSQQESTPQKQASTMFGSNTANAGSTPFKFGQTSQSRQQDEEPPPKKRLFATPTAQDNMARAAGVAGPAEPVQPKFTQPQRPASAKEEVTRAVSTEGPPQIPRYLSADKYKAYDENWRLKALNRHFKKFVGSIDIDTCDLASVVQNYLDHREAIGEGLSQFMRVQTAGSKRKAIDVDDMQEGESSSKKTKPQTLPPAFGSSAKQNATPSNIFGSVPSPKPSAPASTVRTADSSTSNLFKSMIPGATASAPAKSTTPPSSPPKTAAQPPKFELPKFGGAAAGVSFANAFASNAAKSSQELKKTSAEKRKAEEFDSDEDDEEEWSKKYEEEQEAKRRKIEAASKGAFGFIPSANTSRSNSPFAFAPQNDTGSRSNSPFTFGKPSAVKVTPGDAETAAISIESDGDGHVEHSGSTTESSQNESGNSGDDEEEEQEETQDEVEENEEEEGEPIPDLPKGESLFDRISKPATTPQQKEDEPILQSARKDNYKPSVMFGHIGKSTPEQPTFSPFTPANATPKADFVPTTKFEFSSGKATTSFGDSNSVFGGGAVKEGPIPGEGLFGSRPSTPQPGSQDKPAASVFGSSLTDKTPFGVDNRWTKGSPIKFGASTSDEAKDSAPAIEVSSATPPAKESKSLFGSTTKSSGGFFGAASSNGANVGFNFGGASAQPAPGFLSATSHLSAGISSRGSSPGIPSEAESTADEAEAPKDAQLVLAAAGEEDEEVLFETRSVLSRLYKDADLDELKPKIVAGWNKIGNGTVKLLKNKESGKSRIVFRVDPNANILLNTLLLNLPYTSTTAGKQGAMNFMANFLDGKTAQASLRVSTLDKAKELVSLCEANKKN